MKLGRFVWLALIGTLFAAAPSVYAQDTLLTGIVRDNTGGVLPGVTVTATHEAAGTTFVGVTDENGRIAFRSAPGVYRITAELPGSPQSSRPGVEMLVGRQAALTSSCGSRACRRRSRSPAKRRSSRRRPRPSAATSIRGRCRSCRVNGRNWMDLSMLAPGSRSQRRERGPAGSAGILPGERGRPAGDAAHLLLPAPAALQPRLHRGVRAHHQPVRRDAGTVAGHGGECHHQVGDEYAVGGTFSGYFRDDSMNAKDFIQDRVLPYSDQQLSGTFGGPIRRDRIHFFGNYEYEREPERSRSTARTRASTSTFRARAPQRTGGARGDAQFSPQSHLQVRYSQYYQYAPEPEHRRRGAAPFDRRRASRPREQPDLGGSTSMGADDRLRRISSKAAGSRTFQLGLAARREVPRRRHSRTARGWTAARSTSDSPDTLSVRRRTRRRTSREDLLGPRRLHDVVQPSWASRHQDGRRVSVPVRRVGALVQSLHWRARDQFAPAGEHRAAHPGLERCVDVEPGADLAAHRPLRGVVRRPQHGTRDATSSPCGSRTTGRPRNRLTLNLGVRYDLDLGVLGEDIEFRPWLSGNRPYDANNIAPRLGFAFQTDDRTVIRGGYGMFFTQLEERCRAISPNSGRARRFRRS